MASVIVGLMGLKRSGKDTFAERLVEYHGFTRFAFADVLKNMALEVNPIVGKSNSMTLQEIVRYRGWDRAKEEVPAVREFLRDLGQAARNHLGESVWIRAIHRQVVQVDGPVVIADVRLPNEADWVESQGGALVRVLRVGQLFTTHDTELALVNREAAFTVRAESGDVGRLHREAAFLAGALAVGREKRRLVQAELERG